jgi:hypothetical protein
MHYTLHPHHRIGYFRHAISIIESGDASQEENPVFPPSIEIPEKDNDD